MFNWLITIDVIYYTEHSTEYNCNQLWLYTLVKYIRSNVIYWSISAN